ncbi:hypothetical protein B0J13DRAFT_663415 [Dactylonectria estremocensis]|uniref:Uncharacterized protein n=1 Tax=Dactylonectria estremocensis TaxID=1079267 RepID=A0A9P9F1W7_9HYPO|nr:hypothetical protein B0J13DRAFT_663415 [Dactylonectria estremocensis]
MLTTNHAGSKPEGFKFIVSTPLQRRSQDHQRLVRSHVTRGRGRRKGHRPLPSWMNHGADEQPQPNPHEAPGGCLLPNPSRVGSELAWIQFPEVMKPYMFQAILRCSPAPPALFDRMYPTGLCLEVEAEDSAWVGSLMADPVYLHSMLFSSEAWLDENLGRDRSLSAQMHLLKTLRLLQERISVPNDPLAISDQTIMTVVTLALAAQVFGDRAGVENHMQGLQRMVDLRGGFGSLKTSTHELPGKICRVDLGIALTSGRRPAFFRDAISWGCYVDDNQRKRPASLAFEDPIISITEFLNWRLLNVWKDLQQFSNLCNLAGQTGHKLTQTTFSEIMVSVMYRLLHMSFEDCPLNDALRVGMITFTTAMFLQWQCLKSGERHIEESLSSALLKLHESSVHVPPPVLFWLLTVMHTSFSGDAGGRHASWFSEVVRLVPLLSWEEARKALKSMIWVDSVNDDKGREAFEKARLNVP